MHPRESYVMTKPGGEHGLVMPHLCVHSFLLFDVTVMSIIEQKTFWRHL